MAVRYCRRARSKSTGRGRTYVVLIGQSCPRGGVQPSYVVKPCTVLGVSRAARCRVSCGAEVSQREGGGCTECSRERSDACT
eukprot:6400105-Prymnesium_polylepis.2